MYSARLRCCLCQVIKERCRVESQMEELALVFERDRGVFKVNNHCLLTGGSSLCWFPLSQRRSLIFFFL